MLIGGAGFIGSNLVQALVNKGANHLLVLEPDFSSVSRLDGLPVKVYRGEISNLDLVVSIIEQNKVDVVIHLVSTIIPGSTYENFQLEFTSVEFPSIRLMEYCSLHNIKFVYFSSGGTVYGNNTEKEFLFKEEMPMAPISFYGWSKQMMENSILFMNRTQGLQYLILRPSNPYGRGQNLNGKQGLIAVALGRILSGKPITIWGDGEAVRDYIYINDLSKAIADLVTEEAVVNTTVNIGSGKGYSINEIIEILKATCEEPVDVEYVDSRKQDVSSMILSTERIKSLIDYHPIDIKDGIRRFYQYAKYGE